MTGYGINTEDRLSQRTLDGVQLEEVDVCCVRSRDAVDLGLNGEFSAAVGVESKLRANTGVGDWVSDEVVVRDVEGGPVQTGLDGALHDLRNLEPVILNGVESRSVKKAGDVVELCDGSSGSVFSSISAGVVLHTGTKDDVGRNLASGDAEKGLALREGQLSAGNRASREESKWSRTSFAEGIHGGTSGGGADQERQREKGNELGEHRV